MTCNMNECKKFKKDGNLKKRFHRKSSGKGKKAKISAFAQLNEHFTKFEKAMKINEEKLSCNTC